MSSTDWNRLLTVKLRGKKVIWLQGTRSTLRRSSSRAAPETPFQVTPKNEIQADRIRNYLGHLTSQARSSLLVEIERMQMYDEDISGFEIILAELRAEFR